MDKNISGFSQDLVAAAPRLLMAARHLTGDPEEAKDLVQDCLARAWRFRDKFVPGTSLKAWLNCILRNQYYSRLRRLKVERDSAEPPRSNVGYDPPQEFAVTLADVDAALQALPPEMAQALLLVGAEGRRYDEAARTLGCNIGTLKSRVSRARYLLGEAIDPGAERRPRAGGAGVCGRQALRGRASPRGLDS